MINKISSTLFFVKDREQTLNFYKSLGFDAELKDGMVQVALGGFNLNFIDKDTSTFKEGFEVDEKGAGIFTYIKVDDVDEYYKTVTRKGIKPSSEPKDWEWGNREFVIKDPDGYRLVFFKETEK